MSVTIAIPGGGPLFDGHFPGRPILPGVAELVLIARALAPDGGKTSVRAIPYVRFRRPVQPGDVLELSVLDRGEGARMRFTARCQGACVANGELVFGPPASAAGETMAIAAHGVQEAPALDDLVPHRPPMRFVEEILGFAEDGASCLARVPRGCALVACGVVPSLVALEAAAQTAAVWEALRRSRDGHAPAPRIGYLVSAREVTLHRGTIPADADLVASIRLEAHAAPLAQYRVQVDAGNAVALCGTIGTYLTD